MQTFLNNMPFFPANSAPTPNGHPIGNQPPRFTLPQQPVVQNHVQHNVNNNIHQHVQPQYYYADCGIQFGKECNDSVEHIIRGLNTAVSLLLDPHADKCAPNIPAHRHGSWCFPDVNYTNIKWIENNYWSQPQPDWHFDNQCRETAQSVTKKFSDFFCR